MHLGAYYFLELFNLLFVAWMLVKRDIVICCYSARGQYRLKIFSFATGSVKLKLIEFWHAACRTNLRVILVDPFLL